MLSDDEVKHVAKLARIHLKDEEVSLFAKQLSDVLDYMEILNKADVEGVEETSQVTGLENVMEEDEIKKSQSSREELLDCTELPVDSKQIKVKRTI